MKLNQTAFDMATQRKAATVSKAVYLTSKGLEALRAELQLLKKEKRPELIDRIKQAREFGDVSENSEYNAAVEEQSIVEGRIEELEKITREAKIISEKGGGSSVVTIGSTVKLQMDSKTDQFTIVGRVEADPIKKRISNESPLGSALIGGHIGDSVEVKLPQSSYKCKIIEIS